jgi:hypothetical protein
MMLLVGIARHLGLMSDEAAIFAGTQNMTRYESYKPRGIARFHGVLRERVMAMNDALESEPS